MKKLLYLIPFVLTICLVSTTSAVTVAYWRMGDSDSYAVANGAVPDTDQWTIYRQGVSDASGNGNHLTTWEYDGAGFNWRADVPWSTVPGYGNASDTLSIQSAGQWPAAMTWTSAHAGEVTYDAERIRPLAWTVEASFKADSFSGGYAMTAVGRDGQDIVTSNGMLAALYFGERDYNGRACVQFADMAGNTWQVVTDPCVLKEDNWYSMAAVSDGQALKLYLRDMTLGPGPYTLLGSTDISSSSDPRLNDAAGKSGSDWVGGTWTVGRGLYNGGHTDRWYGWIDEVRISDTAVAPYDFLFATSLTHRYSFTNGDTVAVDSVGGRNGTLQGGAAISGNAVQLDGANDYVNLPADLITGYTTLSFEAWFISTSDSGTWTRVWDFGDTNPSSGAGRNYVFFTPKSGSNTFRYAISDADPGYDHEENIQTTPTATGVPIYVACVHDSNGVVKLYVNGQLASSGTFSIPLSSLNNVYSYLGKSLYTVDPYLKGSIDEFRIYNSTLTAEEIALNYINGPDVIGHSRIVIQETNGSTEVTEGNSIPDTYTVALSSQPQADVTLTVDPDEQLDIGNGHGGSIQILFTPQDWSVPQTVTVRAYDDDVLETDPHIGIINHFISSSDPKFNNISLPSVRVTIRENECGAWGFYYFDLNFDCQVNFTDFAVFALYWLSQFDAENLETFAAEWLKTTQPYAPGAEHGPVQDSPNPLFIEPNEIVGQINEKIYGHFLEHIYHSANGGLWGELVWNRSLEQWPGGVGTWSIDGNDLVQSSLNTDVRLLFGDTNWQDYDYTLQAKKTGGSEGFLIIFRANGDNFYWCNLGGWGNTIHAFEKSVTGPSRGIVGPEVAGSITTDHWYDVHIRCEGGHYQVWLDGTKIIDWTDTSSPHLSGQVGLGTWATTARFRNIQVTAIPSGTILFSGLPSVGSTQAVPTYWTGYGNSSFYLNTSALNSDFCLQINKNDSAESGIEQTPFNIKVQQYTGSVWARGTATGSMVVRILDGSTVLGQSILPAPDANWTEYPFSITPSEPALNATLQIGVGGTGTLYLDQISMMGQDSIGTGGYRPDLLQAVADLRPPVIRWPGGYFAEMYRWKSGIGPQSGRIKYPFFVWDDLEVNSYGTDEFIAMCRIVGAEPLIVINIGNHDSAEKRPEYIQEALDWIEYCNGPANSPWGSVRAANGHPQPYSVKYWEISNETWFMGSSAYCQAVQQFVPPMTAKDPNIKIAVCGSAGFDQSWSQAVINACANIIDYISIHHYESPDNYQSGPPSFEAHIAQLGDIIADSNNPNIKIDMSEWNAQSTDWRTGLYAGGMLNGFERNGDVFEIGSPALFLRHTSATDWDNAFINFDHTGWFPAPNYVVMKLWRDNYAPYRIDMTGPVGNLNAIATKSADGSKIYFKVVNPTDQNVPVKLIISDTFDVGSASLKLVAPGSLSARNSLEDPDVVHAEDAYVGLNNQTIRFTMHPISAGVVKVSRKE